MYPAERLKGLDVFVCVAESGSFVAAAERLNLTASAVGKAIARLESRLGRRLFERTTRRMALTDAGVAFHRTCTDVLASLEDAELALQAEDREPRGRVRLDLPAAFGRLQALPLVLQFARDYPHVQPKVSFSDRFIDPVEEGVDIVVRVGGPGTWPAALGHRPLGNERHVFCAAPDYLRGHGTPATPEELDAHQCITYGRADGTVSPWRFAGARAGEMQQRAMRAHLVLGDGEAQATAAVLGSGIAQLPTWLIRAHLEAGRLVEVLPACASEGLPIGIGWVRRREKLPKVSLLLEALTTGLVSRLH